MVSGGCRDGDRGGGGGEEEEGKGRAQFACWESTVASSRTWWGLGVSHRLDRKPLGTHPLIHMCTLGIPVPALASKDADILKSSWDQGLQTGSLLPGCPQVRGMPLAPSNILPSPIHRSGGAGGKLPGWGWGGVQGW